MTNIHRILLSIALGSLAAPGFALESLEQTQREIDRSLWQPFQCAFENMDGAALNKLYVRRVLRVTPDGIDTQGSFKSFNKTRFDKGRQAGDRLTLDFWFDSRATNRATSYDVGFYRLGTITSAGSVEYYYGQFHIVLRKQRGRWKIVQDWDTNMIAGRPLGAEEFSRGTPLASDCPR